MKNFKALMTVLFVGTMLIISGCDKENGSIDYSGNGSSSSKITMPSFDKFLSTVDTDGFAIRARFKTGGDSEGNIRATVHWKNYSGRPSSTPGKSDLTKSENMRQRDVTYHNTGSKKGTTESIVFEKEHGGYNGGTYIYYYVECTNSKGTAVSPISHVIVKTIHR